MIDKDILREEEEARTRAALQAQLPSDGASFNASHSPSNSLSTPSLALSSGVSTSSDSAGPSTSSDVTAASSRHPLSLALLPPLNPEDIIQAEIQYYQRNLGLTEDQPLYRPPESADTSHPFGPAPAYPGPPGHSSPALAVAAAQAPVTVVPQPRSRTPPVFDAQEQARRLRRAAGTEGSVDDDGVDAAQDETAEEGGNDDPRDVQEGPALGALSSRPRRSSVSSDDGASVTSAITDALSDVEASYVPLLSSTSPSGSHPIRAARKRRAAASWTAKRRFFVAFVCAVVLSGVWIALVTWKVTAPLRKAKDGEDGRPRHRPRPARPPPIFGGRLGPGRGGKRVPNPFAPLPPFTEGTPLACNMWSEPALVEVDKSWNETGTVGTALAPKGWKSETGDAGVRGRMRGGRTEAIWAKEGPGSEEVGMRRRRRRDQIPFEPHDGHESPGDQGVHTPSDPDTKQLWSSTSTFYLPVDAAADLARMNGSHGRRGPKVWVHTSGGYAVGRVVVLPYDWTQEPAHNPSLPASSSVSSEDAGVAAGGSSHYVVAPPSRSFMRDLMYSAWLDVFQSQQAKGDGRSRIRLSGALADLSSAFGVHPDDHTESPFPRSPSSPPPLATPTGEDEDDTGTPRPSPRPPNHSDYDKDKEGEKKGYRPPPGQNRVQVDVEAMWEDHDAGRKALADVNVCAMDGQGGRSWGVGVYTRSTREKYLPLWFNIVLRLPPSSASDDDDSPPSSPLSSPTGIFAASPSSWSPQSSLSSSPSLPSSFRPYRDLANVSLLLPRLELDVPLMSVLLLEANAREVESGSPSGSASSDAEKGRLNDIAVGQLDVRVSAGEIVMDDNAFRSHDASFSVDAGRINGTFSVSNSLDINARVGTVDAKVRVVNDFVPLPPLPEPDSDGEGGDVASSSSTASPSLASVLATLGRTKFSWNDPIALGVATDERTRHPVTVHASGSMTDLSLDYLSQPPFTPLISEARTSKGSVNVKMAKMFEGRFRLSSNFGRREYKLREWEGEGEEGEKDGEGAKKTLVTETEGGKGKGRPGGASTGYSWYWRGEEGQGGDDDDASSTLDSLRLRSLQRRGGGRNRPAAISEEEKRDWFGETKVSTKIGHVSLEI